MYGDVSHGRKRVLRKHKNKTKPKKKNDVPHARKRVRYGPKKTQQNPKNNNKKKKKMYPMLGRGCGTVQSKNTQTMTCPMLGRGWGAVKKKLYAMLGRGWRKCNDHLANTFCSFSCSQEGGRGAECLSASSEVSVKQGNLWPKAIELVVSCRRTFLDSKRDSKPACL